MQAEDSAIDIENSEPDTSSVYLFSPMYSHQERDCLLCVYQYLPQYKSQIQKFQTMLEAVSSKVGCGIETCVQLILRETEQDADMILFRDLGVKDIVQHFDTVFGHPMCGYNRLKKYNFFTLFNENSIDNKSYVNFVYNTYKHSRSTSLCPYALLAVYVFMIMSNTIGDVSEYKKKHDFLWMYNCLSNHKIRSGRN
jgi:hypothetical protein